MFRESIQFLLAKDEISVDTHLEYSAPALDQSRGYSVLVIDISRQTGGLWCVVSLQTVFDTDLHDRFPPIHRVGSLGASWSFMVRIQEQVFQHTYPIRRSR